MAIKHKNKMHSYNLAKKPKMPKQITYNSTLHKNQIRQPTTSLLTSSHKKNAYALRYDSNSYYIASLYTPQRLPYPYPTLYTCMQAHTLTHQMNHTHRSTCLLTSVLAVTATDFILCYTNDIVTFSKKKIVCLNFN